MRAGRGCRARAADGAAAGDGRVLRLALDDVLDLVVHETAGRHEAVAGG
ncbi:hypothetical protein [Streptomyces canus]|nr:hypothetical protein [Streptomyces canus]WSD83089.1 hypothetical protein OG925_01445 [Streptomyces canus]